MKLINEQTDREIKIGDEVTTFRGEKGILKDFRAPHKASSTGRVYVKFSDSPTAHEYYPGVINAKIVE